MCKKRLFENYAERFNHNGRTIAENFGGREIRSEIGSIVTHPDDGVGSEFDRAGNYGVVGMLRPLLTHLGVGPDAAADDAFETSKDPLGDGRRADNNPEHHPLECDDPVAGNVKGGGRNVKVVKKLGGYKERKESVWRSSHCNFLTLLTKHHAARFTASALSHCQSFSNPSATRFLVAASSVSEKAPEGGFSVA